jgi:hypothetical protein
MIRLAFRFDVLDHPGYHKTHINVHPLLGGGAIFVTFMLVILAGFIVLILGAGEEILPISLSSKSFDESMAVALAALPRFSGLTAWGRP